MIAKILNIPQVSHVLILPYGPCMLQNWNTSLFKGYVNTALPLESPELPQRDSILHLVPGQYSPANAVLCEPGIWQLCKLPRWNAGWANTFVLLLVIELLCSSLILISYCRLHCISGEIHSGSQVPQSPFQIIPFLGWEKLGTGNWEVWDEFPTRSPLSLLTYRISLQSLLKTVKSHSCSLVTYIRL